MNTRYLEDEELDASHDREISLGASTLLGIFLLLAVVCAVFFGFGYTMGRRSAAAVVSAATSSESVLKATSTAKPAPGSVTTAKSSSDPDTSNSGDSTDVQLPRPNHAPAAVEQEQTVAPQKPQPAAKPAAYSSQQPPAPAIATPHPFAATVPAGPPVIVQVAAVSHQEDADTLLSALKRRGYEVAVRHEPQDKLLHIQLGPYATRKEADTMRQRLLADGYNAIVK